MHVTLTARKQRVYSKLVFKTYKKALCNWLRKLSACFDDKLKAELLKICMHCMHARTICNRLHSVNLCLEQTAAMPGQCHFQDAWLDHPQYKNRTVVQSRFLSYSEQSRDPKKMFTIWGCSPKRGEICSCTHVPEIQCTHVYIKTD